MLRLQLQLLALLFTIRDVENLKQEHPFSSSLDESAVESIARIDFLLALPKPL